MQELPLDPPDVDYPEDERTDEEREAAERYYELRIQSDF